jgi:tetratricopeptide (TPR) repeat protein
MTASPRRRLALAGGVAVLAAAALFVALRGAGPSAPRTGTAATGASAEFVGATVCAQCHPKPYAAWRGSQHALAMQLADPKSVLGNFDDATFSYAGTTSRFFRRDAAFIVATDGPDGKLAEYPVKYTFGVYPLQQYLIEFPGGRLQALSIAWDARPKSDGGQRWFHLYPGQAIKAGDALHWTGPNQNWNYMCAECHSTNLRKNYDAATGTFHTTWSEIDVACEACHGPGSNHVAWARRTPEAKGYAGDMGLALALDERKGVTWTPDAATGDAQRSVARTSAREIGMCARCHARSGRLTDDYVYGKPLSDSHRVALLDDGLYWNDGQMRDEVYNWGSFVQSRMYAKGVTCSDCHDPHTLKTRGAGNAVCAQCHLPARYDVPAHTHHPAGTAGASCPACHMPTTTYMVIDPRHDHSLRIPRPDLSVKLGVPNACNSCHRDKTAQWAADAIRAWTGTTPTGYQNFAEAFHAASAGAPGARAALLALVDDPGEPALVRASAVSRLGALLSPATIEFLARALNDPDPVVRRAAVDALTNAEPAVRVRYLARMTTDPVRAVRIDAARALAGAPESGLAAADRPAFAKALDEYIAVQRYNADRPEGRTNLGNLYAERGEGEAALAEYRKALAIDPAFVPAYVNLADAYRARGADADAIAVLREGLAREPRAAALHYALALALVRQKKLPEALPELAEAARLEPDSAHYAYVEAVALTELGRRRDAMQVLAAARKRNPYDREVLEALAQYAQQAGDRAAALGYVATLREIDPDDPRYARFEADLQGRAAR